MSEPEPGQSVVRGDEPVIPKVERSTLSFPVIRIFPLPSGVKECLVTTGLFSAVVREVEDEGAMKEREQALKNRFSLASAQRQTSPGRAARTQSEVVDQMFSQQPIMRQEFSDLRLEGLATQSKVFYFAGNQLQHTKGKGNRFIQMDLTSGDELQKHILDVNQGITLAYDPKKSFSYFLGPKEMEPFDLALICIIAVNLSMKLDTPPSQLLKRAVLLKDDEVFRTCLVGKREGLRKKTVADPDLFKQNMREILSKAQHSMVGTRSNAYI
jgi:hypothetical protein